MDEFTAALADYNRAIELDPGFAPAYENRAIANSYAGGKGKRN
jgi:lipoprotein NlpI